MCGHVGIISNSMQQKDHTAFQYMLMINELRGTHGTGIIRGHQALNKETTYRYEKAAMLPGPFISMLEELKDPVIDFHAMDRFYLGHCRAKTVGVENDANCHPFDFPNVIGMHNGTIHGTFPNKNVYTTDSEALYHAINNYGIKRGLSSFAHTNGAWALVFYDKILDCVSIFRNEKRPMWCAYTKDGTALYYASNPHFILAVTSELNREVEDPWELAPNHIFRLYVDGAMRWNKDNTEIEAFKPTAPAKPPARTAGKVTKLEKKEAPSAQQSAFFQESANKKQEKTRWERPTTTVPGGNDIVQKILPFYRATKPQEAANDSQAALEKVLKTSANEAELRTQYGEYSAGPSAFASLAASLNEKSEKTEQTFIDKFGDDTDYWLFAGINNRVLSLPEYQEELNQGCSGCGEVPDVEQHIRLTGEEPTLFWFGERDYVCAEHGCHLEMKEFLPPHVQEYIEWHDWVDPAEDTETDTNQKNMLI